jgi:hypothetical protein
VFPRAKDLPLHFLTIEQFICYHINEDASVSEIYGTSVMLIISGVIQLCEKLANYFDKCLIFLIFATEMR